MTRRVLRILWPAFMTAGVLEVLVFAVVDPGELHWFGGLAIDWPVQAIYTVTFLLVWGAVAAGSMAMLGTWTQAAPALRPLWVLLQLAFLCLGLCWLVSGRQPGWMRRDGAVPVRIVGRRTRSWRAAFAGLAWVAWPCGA